MGYNFAEEFVSFSYFSISRSTSELPGKNGIVVQHAHFIPIVGVENEGIYYVVHGDLPKQHSFETTLRLTGPKPADAGQ